jgi:hypothetical protein
LCSLKVDSYPQLPSQNAETKQWTGGKLQKTSLLRKDQQEYPAGIGQLEDSTKTEPSDHEIEFWSADFRLALETMLKQRRKEWLTKGKPAPEVLFCEQSGHLINYSRFVKVWSV